MATDIRERTGKAGEVVAELHSGDRMNRQEFHEIYSRMPEGFRAELIGGIVYVSSPLKRPHGGVHPVVGGILFAYCGHTPGTEVYDNATVQLSDESELQPDSLLRILPGAGGQTRDTEDDYIAGAPELVIEIAHSSRAIDLHLKRDDYREGGVLEYLVFSTRDRRLFAFDLTRDAELPIPEDGIYRSAVFPGLWLHVAGIFDKSYKTVTDTLERGLATPEHAAFAARLKAALEKSP